MPTVEFRLSSNNPNNKDFKQSSVQFLPDRQENWISMQYFRTMPLQLQKLYWEITQAYNHGLFTLAAAGLRALVEGVCADKGITGYNLEKKINNLIGLLPNHIVTSLHTFRFTGNIALHKQNPPNQDDVRLAVGVIEDLLNYLYELEYKTSLLSGKSNIRQRR